jgi:hypothetical protein
MPEIGENQGGLRPLMTSSRSLVCPQCRAHNEANLKLTPPCSRELQVLGVVGRNDAPAEAAAGHAPGESRDATGVTGLVPHSLSRGYGTLLVISWEGQLRSRLLRAISARCKRTLGGVE